jgi:hypothetical protein
MNTGRSSDPQWDLVIEIAAMLWVDGQYVARLEPLPTQRLVDLQWAARQAGRVLGGRANIGMSRPGAPKDRTVVVTVTYVDPTGQGLVHAEEGLEALMRQVLEAQARH